MMHIRMLKDGATFHGNVRNAYNLQHITLHPPSHACGTGR